MHESTTESECSSSPIREWEIAGESLANSLSAYLKSCKILETFSSTNGINSKYLPSRIDISLTTLHTKLFEELTQSRVLLARMRNRTFSPFSSLPNEIIAVIFMDVVYSPAPGEYNHFLMPQALWIMYGRLYNLLSVCVTWRDIGIQLAELWSVIPVNSDPEASPTREATSMILERSRASPLNDRPLHLAAILSDDGDPYLPLIDGRLPRFTSINIECERIDFIVALIGELLRHPSSLDLPELSIHHDREEPDSDSEEDSEDAEFRPRPPGAFITTYAGMDSRLFTTLLSSLSILRIRGLDINWFEIAFSNRLVDLRLQSVVFGDESDAVAFLSALQSAAELQYLKIISVVTLWETTEPVPSGTPDVVISFPKLQELLLQDLDYTTLWILLGSITPGPHQTKLFLTFKSKSIYELVNDVVIEARFSMDKYYALLGRSAVHTLILDGLPRETWLDDVMLLRTLQSLPALKTLKLNSWYLTTESLQALERPQAATTSSNLDPFPNLDTLCIFNSQIWDKEALLQTLTSHQLRTLVIGQVRVLDDDTIGGPESSKWGILDEEHPAARHIESHVPHLQILPTFLMDEDFCQHLWGLW